ncbi:MAG: peptide chain release factor N(5)-glutamine methyltransferase [Candidatus Electrothrix sp. GW3-4]|uniref:peptide chain release factor N(5)-glutamine methyltransferase n=1 Tax=Candidatus Electrothrix sp. GW3-4 TaxID=3126740 RepID=UPI0030D4ED8C
MLVHQLLRSATSTLAEAGLEDSALEAELLLRHCLDISRSKLFLLHDQSVEQKTEYRFRELLQRRCQREPLQYIIGSCEFWSLEFFVSPAVLIPRPETEFLLEHCFATLLHNAATGQQPQRILDLCTGSGAIAVVLAKKFPQSRVIASDFSQEALRVANKNISCHKLDDRIHLLRADLLTAFSCTPLFDLIVTNPPYVKADDILTLEPEVRDWEPHLALSGGKRGLDSIARICQDTLPLLQPGGWLFMEIGADIRQEVEQVFLKNGGYEQVRVVDDWAGRPRVLQARRQS